MESGRVYLWKLSEPEQGWAWTPGLLPPGIQIILQQVSALWVMFGQQFLLLVHTR